MVATYVEVEQAIGMSGLRVVMTPSVPGPWTEAARGILHVKRISYIKVRQELGGANHPLHDWTRQTTAPVFIYNDERPRSLWNDQLFFAERLQPDPPLIPRAIDDRVRMIGLSNELCGENGLGWARRLMMLHGTLTNRNASEDAMRSARFMGAKYGYDPALVETAPRRVAEILAALDGQLAAQRARGSRYLIGDRLSALDIYWAAFAALIEPLPQELCPMSPGFRRMYLCNDPAVKAALSPHLLAHRDFIYHEHLELPLDM